MGNTDFTNKWMVMQYDCAGDLFDCYRMGVCDFVKG